MIKRTSHKTRYEAIHLALVHAHAVLLEVWVDKGAAGMVRLNANTAASELEKTLMMIDEYLAQPTQGEKLA